MKVRRTLVGAAILFWLILVGVVEPPVEAVAAAAVLTCVLVLAIGVYQGRVP